MLQPAALFEAVQKQGIRFFAGVPDSLLKDFCAYVTDHTDGNRHVITANEGNAVALAAGHYLGTAEPALVYLQNSGLGNALNPLISLADRMVYGIPMLLMIGWRGEPGSGDEPQHMKQGSITGALLETIEVPWFELCADTPDVGVVVARACALMCEKGQPVALLVRRGAFEPYRLQKRITTDFPLQREGAIQCIMDWSHADDIFVTTTGKTSREVYEYREFRGDGHGNDFLTVGSMGHASSIALGLAQTRPGQRIICLDGDGAALMHFGALAVMGQSGLSNLMHVVINNGAHDSVGGQPTAGFGIDMTVIAESCGYTQTHSATTLPDIRQALEQLAGDETGSKFLEVRVNKGARNNLGRPATTPQTNKKALMERLGLQEMS